MSNTKPVTPFDLFKRSSGRVPVAIAAQRFAICKGCPRFMKWTGQCRECGCFMKEKTKLPMARCPLNPPKWEQSQPESITVTDQGA